MNPIEAIQMQNEKMKKRFQHFCNTMTKQMTINTQHIIIWIWTHHTEKKNSNCIHFIERIVFGDCKYRVWNGIKDGTRGEYVFKSMFQSLAMEMKQEQNTRVFMLNYMQTQANIDVKLKERDERKS